jgi:hypothetical protein
MIKKIIGIIAFCIACSWNSIYAESLDDAVLRSGVVIGNIDIPNKLTPGNSHTIWWIAQAYVPIKSKLFIKYADGEKDSVLGTLEVVENGDYSISNRSSKKYYFKATLTVPSDKSGDASVGFHNAQDDGEDEFWMFGIFPSGVITRPDGTAGKLFKVSVGF